MVLSFLKVMLHVQCICEPLRYHVDMYLKNAPEKANCEFNVQLKWCNGVL